MPTETLQLPVGSSPQPLETPHFPDRLHAFVWRNWQLIAPERLAEVVGTTAEKVHELARSLGLPAVESVSPALLSRGYITIVRRNWHLLPYEQLVALLGKSPEEFAFLLREDDGLFLKLGNHKPACPPLRYREPSATARQRAAEIRDFVQRQFGDELVAPAEARFQFVDQLSQTDPAWTPHQSPGNGSSAPLRLVYSYFGGYGDPLAETSDDPYPDGLLEKLADNGVNGVWLHIVLRQLAPGGAAFPEFGRGSERRLAKLNALARRAGRYGIGVYLYVNEPRAMPAAFFAERGDMAGVREGDYIALCTSDHRVRQWLTDSLAHVFREAPDLAGMFSITASENLTNCACRFHHDECPRCRDRAPAEIVAEINAAIEAGVHQGNPRARVIVWDWGWNHHGDSTREIAALPENIELMSASEWSIPIERGGVPNLIGEYSLSTPGPGPRATLHWQLAKQRGFRTVAKVQLNNSWELSSVPFLPVLDLVAEHCQALAAAQIDGMMLGWTLGGYPSPNLQVAQRFTTHPGATKDGVLDAIAIERYGPAAASHVRRAWTIFSQALREYPFDLNVLYYAPQQWGPANLLYGEPTGYEATTVGIPYDDVATWRGPYPAETLANQFAIMATTWATGLEHFDRAVAAASAEKREVTLTDRGLAAAVHLHFASTANQVRFTLARDELRRPELDRIPRQELLNQIERLLDDEIKLATALFPLVQVDSRIGFEASNHYFYLPLDLVEKAISCEHLRRSMQTAARNG